MLARLIVLAAAALFAVTGEATAYGPYGSIRLRHWAGGAYTNDTTGAFSHCAAVGTYHNGISVLVGMRANHEWMLGFGHPAWKLTPGEVIPVALTFDDREQFDGLGSILLANFIVVPMPQNSALLKRFRRAALMTASAKGEVFTFALTSTWRLMPVLARCVDRMNRGGIQAANDFSVTFPARHAWKFLVHHHGRCGRRPIA